MKVKNIERKRALTGIIKKEVTYPQVIALGFFILIAIGTALLMLPFASRDGHSAGLVNCMFTATSASCVTGLVVYDTYTQWSLFGQLVIISLIQIGGLGFMTILTMFSMFFKRKIGLKERSLLQESVNTMYIGGIVRLIRKILIGTLIFEGTGAVLLSFKFIPLMGVAKGIYTSIFMSVSAFCNAGFDLMGEYGEYSSLTMFADDPLVNITISLLILIGGIGFFVWDDISKHKHHFRKYQLHTKIVLTATIFLTVAGTIAFYLLERNYCMKDMSFGEALLASFFSSVTPRTAGFNTIDTGALTPGSELLTIIFMFIGGSSGSTAGGIKTTTAVVLLVCVWSSLRNSPGNNIFNRRLETDSLRRACSVVVVNMVLILSGGLIICAAQQNIPINDIVFEIFSAIDTVGMTTGITRDLETIPRLVVLLLMYLGRVGSLSFALLFAETKSYKPVLNPVEKINIG